MIHWFYLIDTDNKQILQMNSNLIVENFKKISSSLGKPRGWTLLILGFFDIWSLNFKWISFEESKKVPKAWNYSVTEKILFPKNYFEYNLNCRICGLTINLMLTVSSRPTEYIFTDVIVKLRFSILLIRITEIEFWFPWSL